MIFVCVVRMVDVAVRMYQQGLGRGLKPVDAWNLSTCDWVAAVKVGHAWHKVIHNPRMHVK